MLDDAVVDPAADTQPCSQPPPNNEVGNDVTLTFEPCHNLNIDWDCAEALLIDYRHTSEMYCSAGGNDDHVSMATSASHMALAVAINDLKLHGFSTYSTIRFTFQMGFQDLATDAGVDNVLWHRWLPRLRSEMLKMISTIKCGVYKLQQGSGNGMVNHGLQNSSMLLYDQSCYPNAESIPKLLNGIMSLTACQRGNNDARNFRETNQLGRVTLGEIRNLLRQQGMIFRQLDMQRFPWPSAFPESRESLHSSNLYDAQKDRMADSRLHNSCHTLHHLFVPELMQVMEYLTSSKNQRSPGADTVMGHADKFLQTIVHQQRRQNFPCKLS